MALLVSLLLILSFDRQSINIYSMEEEVKYILKDDRDLEISLRKVYEVLISKWKQILLIGMVAGVLAFAFNINLPPYYDSSAMLASTMFNATEIMPILNPMSEAVSNGNLQELKKSLKVSDSVLGTVKSLEFVSQGYDEELFTCEVNLQVTDTNTIPIIEKAILQNLMSNPYFLERYSSKQEQWNSVYEKTIEEIGNLNKMKLAIDDIDAKVQAGLIVYPLNIHSELVHMEEKAANIKWRRDMLSIAYYLRKATMPSSKSGPSVLKNTLAVIIAVSLFSALLFILNFALLGPEAQKRED